MTQEIVPVNTQMTIFENPEFGKVRVVMREGEPWFVAKDVCDCLTLSNVSQAVSYLDEDEKLALEANIISNDVGGRGTLLVSEPGLYSLIMRSRKREAKAFKRWVTHDVLPAIRKTGSYSLNRPIPQTFAEALRAYADEVERREQAETSLQQYHNVLGQMVALAKNQMATIEAQADELGQGKTWRTVKAISWLPEVFVTKYKTEDEWKFVNTMYQQVGKKLKSVGISMGLPPQEINDVSYGTILKHHVKAIEKFYHMLMADKEMMRKYRID